jgi:hypothetical protein
MTADKTLNVAHLRESFASFWNDQLKIEAVRDGLIVSPPLLYADGWQVVLFLKALTPSKWLIHDGGEVLGRLADAGISQVQSQFSAIFEQQAQFYGFEQDGLILQRVIDYPFQIADIQIFAEALVALSHQAPKIQKEVRVNTEQLIEQRVNSFFYNRQLQPKRRFKLEGQVEKSITVDYYLEGSHPLALQPVNRSQNLLPYMEQWGWRWTDLKNRYPEMKRVMVYDPDNQKWDRASLNIGRSVCDIFVPYTETEEAMGSLLTA